MKSRLVRGLAVGAVFAGACAMPGCYERVVGARGPGADGVKIEKGNLPDPKGDKTLGYKKIELKSLPD